MKETDGSLRPGWSLVILFGTIALLAAFSGYWFYRHESRAIRQIAYNDLKAIGELKVNEITAWCNERVGDARGHASSSLFRSAVERWLKSSGDVSPKMDVLGYIESIGKSYRYENIILVGPDGRVLFSVDSGLTELASTRGEIARALTSPDAVLGDFSRSPVSGRVYLDVAAAVFDEDNRPMAVLILRTDPGDYLYPLIKSWPTPSRTAETFLVRREGDEALFLNVLRHRGDPALTLSIPLSRRDVPAVQAALGKAGRFAGLDYRGVKVLSDIRPVPGSSWMMVSKMDSDEILAEARYRRTVIGLVTFMLILLAGMGAGYIYRGQGKRAFEALYRAERARREAQEEIRATLYGIGDGVISTDGNGCVTRMNPVAEALTGWKEEDALKRPLEEVFHIVHEETGAEVENPVARVLREGKVVGLANHTVLKARNGREFPLADSGAPIRNENGEICGVVLVFRDQTEERTAQRALRKSEAGFRLLSETAGRLLVSENPQRSADELCRRVMEHLDCQFFSNYLVDEQAGALRLNACAGIPDQQAREIELLDYGGTVCGCAARDGVAIVVENILDTPDCRTELLKANGIRAYACHPLLGQGQLIGTLAFGTRTRDSFSLQEVALMKTVTGQVAAAMDRIKLVKELQRSRDELEFRVRERTAELVKAGETLREQSALLDLAHDAIIVRGLDRRIRYWNQGAEALYHFTKEEALGKVSLNLLKTGPDTGEEMDECLVKKSEWEGELDHSTKEGRRVVVESRQVLLRNAESEPMAILEINRDITARKQAEEANQSYLSKLESMNRELQDFAFIASHDLQEPLRKILVFGGFLKTQYAGVLGDAGRDFLQRMQQAAERMSMLIRDLLNYSRVMSKTDPFKLTDLNTVVREVLIDLETRIEETGAVLEVGGLDTIAVDASQIRQIFQNLISNALKFRREQNPVITIRGEYTADRREYRAFVEDNGIGFDEIYVDRIFAPFQRLHPRGDYEGTGMGLAICRKIAERHGGTITAKSRQGAGSTFILTLPVDSMPRPEK